MASTRRTGSSVWIIMSVAVTVLFGVFSFVWTIVEGQISEVRADLMKYQSDNRWSYATKDFVTGKVDGIKEEETTYRRMLERQLDHKP